MSLSDDQIASLLNTVSAAEPDELDCDNCFALLSEFAEAELSNQEVPEAIKAVEIHLKQCACCSDEYDALLTGLRELERNDNCE